jgi:hypothetical protein
MDEPSPRPWRVAADDYHVLDADGRVVCSTILAGVGVDWETQRNNARLIVEAVNFCASFAGGNGKA